MNQQVEPTGEFLLYETDDGRARVECRFAADTLWLAQSGMADLFQTSKQNIAKHLKAIFAEGEGQRVGALEQMASALPKHKKPDTR